jgi:hypothetical protein
MRKGRWLSLLAVALVTSACGGGEVEPMPTTTGASPTDGETATTTMPPTTAPPSKAVGTVLQVILPVARVNEAQAFAGDRVPAGSTVSTDGVGSVDFGLEEKIDRCRLLNSSSVQVTPTGDVLLKYLQGTAWCVTDTDPTFRMLADGQGTEIAVSDPVFGVTVEADHTVVSVASGFVEVSSRAVEGASVVVGPDQQSLIFPDQAPATPGPFAVDALPPDEQTAVGTLLGGLPEPDFGPPDPAGSPTLTRVFERETIVVAVDEGSIGDAGTGTFIETFVEFLAREWGVKPFVFYVPLDRALTGLAVGDVDVVVTPVPPPETGSLPFFQDQVETTWQMAFDGEDGVFRDALSDFLVAALQAGEYGTRYVDAFGVTPSYEPLRPLLGL